MQGAKVEFFSMEYNSGLRKQEEVKLGEVTSDANGWAYISEAKQPESQFAYHQRQR
jgi:hypothetical protein